ncbi:MAG: hypothetical protein AAF206_32105, partial [Bacteroidota bacterium]
MFSFRPLKNLNTPILRIVSRFSILVFGLFAIWGMAVSQQLSDSSGSIATANNWQKVLQVKTNPTADELEVKLQAYQNGNVQLLLLNDEGRIMQRTTRFAESGRNIFAWHLRPHLPAGHYLIRVES